MAVLQETWFGGAVYRLGFNDTSSYSQEFTKLVRIIV